MSTLHAYIASLPDSVRYKQVDPESPASRRLIETHSAAARTVLGLTRARQLASTTANDSLYRALQYWAYAILRKSGFAVEGMEQRPDMAPIRVAIVAAGLQEDAALAANEVADAVADSLGSKEPESKVTLQRRLEFIAGLVARLPSATIDELFPLIPIRWNPNAVRDGPLWARPADVERLVAVARAAGLFLPHADAELVWRMRSAKSNVQWLEMGALTETHLLEVIQAHSTYA